MHYPPWGVRVDTLATPSKSPTPGFDFAALFRVRPGADYNEEARLRGIRPFQRKGTQRQFNGNRAATCAW